MMPTNRPDAQLIYVKKKCLHCARFFYHYWFGNARTRVHDAVRCFRCRGNAAKITECEARDQVTEAQKQEIAVVQPTYKVPLG
jgi:hypothetical protein